MRIGVLKTGRPPRPAIATHGTYPAMFMRLLGPEAYDWRVYAADEGHLPDAPEDCDAYIVTGSAAGVYDDEPWIAGLFEFLRSPRGRAKLVGICFGHQAMAQAFGGEVIKSPKGWGIGAHDYRILAREPWMGGPDALRLPASHQDQVVAVPPGAEITVGSDFTPIAGLVWRDHPSISFQPHPEFEPAYACALIEARRGKVYDHSEADRAVDSYASADDRARVAGWIGRFLAG